MSTFDSPMKRRVKGPGRIRRRLFLLFPLKIKVQQSSLGNPFLMQVEKEF